MICHGTERANTDLDNNLLLARECLTVCVMRAALVDLRRKGSISRKRRRSEGRKRNIRGGKAGCGAER